MPIINSRFRPAWWCRNPHVQTLWPYFLRMAPRPSYRRERLDLPDGDYLDLDWLEPTSDGPLVLILHGLEGCSRSHYVRGLVAALSQCGIRSVVMHHRGCGGEPNRLDRGYHAGETSDLDLVLNTLRQREPQTSIAAVGYSLGGNVLLKWLCERSGNTSLITAVAVSVPFLLAEGTRRMAQGMSRLYQWRLVVLMRRSLKRKFANRAAPIDLARVRQINTFRSFDDNVTAPLHGFRDAEDYYRCCSSRRFLAGIATPTLIIHAMDDPMTTPYAVPGEAEISDEIVLELSDRGGHVGFVSGTPWRPVYWLDQRIGGYLAEKLASVEHG